MRHFVLFLILYMYVVYTCERVLSDLRWRFIGPLGIVHSQFSNTMLKSLTTLWSCDLKCFDNGGIFITLVPYYDYLCDNKTWTFFIPGKTNHFNVTMLLHILSIMELGNMIVLMLCTFNIIMLMRKCVLKHFREVKKVCSIFMLLVRVPKNSDRLSMPL